MNVEAQIIELMLRIQEFEPGPLTREDIIVITMGIVLALTNLSEIRAEVRQDLAALSDELAGLRRHMNEHLTSIRSELLLTLSNLRRDVTK
ncbi:hypothetical protein [Nonomuraea insulae]|uniref:Gas vesicle protein GvpK n=1 Tax=Nonomuraea insulae TaxID=1616787 RepID=A0ABW1D1H7_9ACTN